MSTHTLSDGRKIAEIARRAVELAARQELTRTKLDTMNMAMDITAAHHSCPMRLDGLLQADDASFGHDVFGIRRHLDRKTGKLLNGFLPRFAKPTATTT